MVQEWSWRHRQTFTLELTGPAGGHWGAGAGTHGPVIRLDAADFCRTLSGRPLPGGQLRTGLLATSVPFYLSLRTI